ncbi:MAG: sigma-70 family RNA polymerase sigma factor [Planctomyces sp.]|nr:sigma-70 family RNA polymerase sigma factor [Planctomyces sp.]
MSDRLLAERIRTGDEGAAEELYQRYALRLRGLADRQMSAGIRAMHEPEDIVQSAFRSLFRGVVSGDYVAPEGSSLWSLLAVIAIHKVRRKASRNRSVAASSMPLSDSGIAEFDVAAEGLTAEQFECSIREAIEQLRPAEQEIVHLRVQGYTVEEISDRLQRSCRTIERSLHSIREKLADVLLIGIDEAANGNEVPENI